MMAVIRGTSSRSTLRRFPPRSCLTTPAASPSSSFSSPPRLILGIETSCDDTGAAVVDASGRVWGESLKHQHSLHLAHGGVVPSLARDAHALVIDTVVEEAMDMAGVSPRALAGVAVTVGPGLVICLRVGVRKARILAAENGLPFLPIHHMEAHALVARVSEEARGLAKFPFLALLVSGGHNLLLLARGLGDYTILGTTLDDAAGEAFDKTARLLNLDLGVGGGPALEAMAERGQAKNVPLPLPLRRSRLHRKSCDFSFAGLKSAIRMLAEDKEEEEGLSEEELSAWRADAAASFQATVVKHLRERTERAVEWAREVEPELSCLVVSGGVASNASVRVALREVAEEAGIPMVCPPPKLCTDNGVMVAWAGQERFAAGLAEAPPPLAEARANDEDVRYELRPRWPIGEADERSAQGVPSQKTRNIAKAPMNSPVRVSEAKEVDKGFRNGNDLDNFVSPL